MQPWVHGDTDWRVLRMRVDSCYPGLLGLHLQSALPSLPVRAHLPDLHAGPSAQFLEAVLGARDQHHRDQQHCLHYRADCAGATLCGPAGLHCLQCVHQ